MPVYAWLLEDEDGMSPSMIGSDLWNRVVHLWSFKHGKGEEFSGGTDCKVHAGEGGTPRDREVS